MVRRKDSFWMYANDLKNGRFSCNFCKQGFSGGITRIKSHLSGVSGHDIQICQQVPPNIQFKAREAIGTPTKRAKCMAASSNVQDVENVLGSSSSLMLNLGKGHDKSKVDKQFAKFLMVDRNCFDAFQSPLFKDFVNGVAKHGPGYELPSCLTLKSRLMPEVENEVEEYLKNVKEYLVKTGCTLIWDNSLLSHPLFFVYTPIGLACMGRSTLDQRNIFQSFKEKISFDTTNVVQLIIADEYGLINSPDKCKLDMYPWIYHSSCASHMIQSLLREIYNAPWVYNTLKVAEWIVLYIYKNKVNVPLRRVQRRRDTVVAPFFRLISLLEVKSQLQSLQISFLTCSSDLRKQLNKEQGRQVARRVMFIEDVISCKEFWSRVTMLSPIMQSLLQAYFLVQRDGPTSGYLYEMIERVKDAVKQCCDNNYAIYDVMWKLLNDARKKIIHPIHVAAAFLNPIYMSEKFKENDEMLDGVSYIREHLVMVEDKEAFKNEVELYQFGMKDSELFTNEVMQMLKTYHPRIWWECHGDHLPVLQKSAIWILSQTCRSPFSMMENNLYMPYSDKDGNDKDYEVRVNTIMMEKYKSLETQMNEPIIFEKLCEVPDDDRDDDWEDEYEESFQYFTSCYDDSILKDTSGSWLDRWPRQEEEPEFDFLVNAALVLGDL